MILITLMPDKMVTLNSILTPTLKKWSKTTLSGLLIIFASLWFRSVVKDSKEFQQKMTDGQEEIKANQDIIIIDQAKFKEYVADRFNKNDKGHDSIISKVGYIELRQDVVIKNMPKKGQSDVQSVIDAYEQLRKNQGKPSTLNSLPMIETFIFSSQEMSMITDTTNEKKNTVYLEN
jgi:hypothetical protein